MPCYEPNIIFMRHTPGNPKGEMIKYINSRKPEFAGYEIYDKLQKEEEKKWQWQKALNMPWNEYMKVPCLQCIGCQETYSKEWAIRCMLEAQQWKQNFFLTLTYDEDNIPRDDELVNKKTGEVFENDNWLQGHLVPEHLTAFFKKLRRHYEYHYNHDNIRFYACGEYGDQTKRPHYHAVVFNLPIEPDKLKVHHISKNGDILWECDKIQKIWGKGFVSLAEVNWDTCAYVARYVMKKMKGWKEDEFYYEQGMSPEFVRMSRKPGIGLQFFDDHFQDIYKNDEIILKGHREKIQPVKPPSYYDRKYDLLDHEALTAIKEKRKAIAKEVNKTKALQTSLSEKDRLKMEKELKHGKWASLKRNKI